MAHSTHHIPVGSDSQPDYPTVEHLLKNKDQYQLLVHGAIAEGGCLLYEYVLPNEMNNQNLWFSAKICPAEGSQVIWVAHDITPIKQAQQELFIYQQELEDRVQERTTQLSEMNTALQAEAAQRKAIASELQREKTFLSTIFNCAGVLLVVLDPKGRIVRCNLACEKLTGYPLAEVQGKYVWELCFRTEDTVSVMRDVRCLLAEKKASTQDMSWYSRDGRLHHISWTHAFLADENVEDGMPYIISAGVDISDRRALETSLKTLNQELEQRVEVRTQELQKIQTHLRQQLAAVDAAVEAIAILQDKQFISVNPAFLDLFGYPHLLSLKEHSWQHLFDPNETERIHQEILPQLLTQRSWQGEAIARRLNGSTFTQEVSLTLTKDEFLICVCRDITNRKLDAAKLLNTEALLRSQYDNFPIPTYTWQHRNGHFYLINYNAAADRAKDPQLSDFAGRTSEVIYGVDHEIHHNIVQCFSQQQSFEAELATQHRSYQDHQIFTRYQIISYIYIAPDMVMVHTQDLTERKHAETKLRENQAFLRQIIDNDPNLIFVKDSQGRFVLANQAVADLYDTKIQSIIGQTECVFNTQINEVERFRETDGLVLEQQQPMLFQEEKVTDASGTERYFRVIKIPLNLGEDHQELKVLGVASDITQRRQAQLKLEGALQQERKLNYLKTHFIDTASHELRTPLTVILGATDILQNYAGNLTPERQHSHLQNIFVNAQRLEKLITNLLSMSRLESGKLQCDRQPSDVVALCQRELDDLKLGIGKKHRLQFIKGDSIPETLSLDPSLIRHILNNLLANACKYSPENALVTLEATYDGEYIYFVIQDEGIGIPEADQAHLFESFFRASNVRAISGSGLGLSIVREYVQLHGGTIHFTSEVESGSSFFVTIPVLQD